MKTDMPTSKSKTYQIKYNYPPANKTTVCNIARACLHHPKFYYQVLHLMNKMNLMPPFGETPSQFQDNIEEIVVKSISSDESEIESDNYVVNTDWSGKIFKRRVKKLKTGILGEVRKKQATDNEFKSGSTHNEGDENIFEPNQLMSSSIKININSELLPSQQVEETSELTFGFGQILSKSAQTTLENEEKSDDWINNLATTDEIKQNRLSPEELANVPAYKDYTPGPPSCRLYLKNIGKRVTDLDLKRIYGRYINLENESEKNMFHVQVFKTGRFRNQAFISLPNEESAGLALQETNGYLLDGKPIIVHYARSIKASPMVTNSS